MKLWLVRLGVAAAASIAAPGSAREPAEFGAVVDALAAGPHRLTGTEHAARAADFLVGELRGRGVDQVFVQEFVTLQTRTRLCRMTDPGSGRQWPLLPARPNAQIPAVTPPEGLRGKLVSALEDPDDETAWREAIVVFRSGDGAGWRRAFRLGARAVLFAEDAAPSASLHTEAPLVAPRFLLPSGVGDLPWGREVMLESSVVWEPVLGRNVIGLVAGTAGAETVVVATARDSFGEIPELAPGARRAANCAALLELAGGFVRHRPARNLAFCFFDGEARGLAGSTAFYGLVAAPDAGEDLAARRASLERETSFLSGLQQAVNSSGIGLPRGEAGRHLARQLQTLAAAELDALQRRMGLLRRVETTEPGAIAAAEEERARWNEFRRALHNGALTSGHQPEWDRTLARWHAELAARMSELTLERAAVVSDTVLAEAWPPGEIVQHLAIELGDATERWALSLGGDSSWHSLEDRPGLHGRLQMALRDGTALALEAGSGGRLFETASVDGRLPAGRSAWGGPRLIHSGETAGLYGLYNGVLITVQEALRREGSPHDTPQRLNSARILAQTRDLAPVLQAAVDDPRLGVRRVIRPSVRRVSDGYAGPNRPSGPQVWSRAVGASVAQRPVAGAVITVRPLSTDVQADAGETRARYPAHDDFRLARSSANGTYRLTATTAKEGGDWAHAVVFDDWGWPRRSSNLESAKQAHARLQVFPAEHGWMATGPARQAGTVRLLDARSNAPLDQRRSWSGRADGWLYWFHDDAIGGVRVFGLDTAVLLAPGAGGPAAPVFQRGAEDLGVLNNERLALLRSHGIASASVEDLQRRSNEWLAAARTRPERAGGEAAAAASFWAAAPAYESLAATFHDLVVAVLLLLLLAIPFAFALERLLVGATSIYRQIGWFAGLFAASFCVLYLTHPAFALSSTPLIIFLGFAILLLSGAVIIVLLRKFEDELKAARGQAGAVHSGDVSRVGAMLAAMGMGLSTMRRRPLRTALTAVTVFFLTFCVLVFASFAQTLGVTRTYVEPLPAYAGVLVQRADLGPLPGHLEGMLAEGAPGRSVAGRWWDAQNRLGGATWPLTTADGRNPAALRGLLGLAPDEIAARPDWAAALGMPADDRAAWIAEGLAARLGAGAGDEVLFAGRSLRVERVLARPVMAGWRDLGGGSPLPVDFTSLDEVERPGERTAGLREPPRPQTPLDPDEMIVVTAATARSIGAPLRAVALVGGDPAGVPALADDLAVALRLPVAATGPDGTYWHFLAAVVEASGWRDLLIPVLLGGLVILGTMLGSVVDREREIYTFSALGLSPGHVAGLFLAEAAVYAIVGGFAGYLGVQVLGRATEALADRGWIAGVEMNHSSLNAMVSLLVVIVTVLGSALYPAVRASRSANPGLARRFELPPLSGDELRLDFPFTVSEFDFPGVVTFLHEHFASLTDGSLGSFQTASVRLQRTEEGPVLEAEVAVRPYDLGVTQTLHLSSVPSRIEGVREVRLRLRRLSGEPKNWWRLNRRFVQDLRRQFLLWRSLSEARMDAYRRDADAMGEVSG